MLKDDIASEKMSQYTKKILWPVKISLCSDTSISGIISNRKCNCLNMCKEDLFYFEVEKKKKQLHKLKRSCLLNSI